MALLLKNGLLYLHIPKTGGNWLTKLLRDHGCVRLSIEDKHATYDLVAGRLRKRSFIERKFTLRGVESLHYMAVVRNPLTWYESWFKYQTSKQFKDWGQIRNVRKWHVMSSINEGLWTFILMQSRQRQGSNWLYSCNRFCHTALLCL